MGSFLLRLSCLIFLFCLINQSAHSQESTLDTVVVTGSLQRQLVKETGRNIIVINKADIERLPANSFDELMKYIPGVEVQQRGPQGAQSDISIRGGTFQQVLVIIDGVRLNDPITGHFNSYVPIHPKEIERIEVLKGSAAAVFGPDAVGGVIHVITKSNAEMAKGNATFIEGKVVAGSYGLFNRSAFASIVRKSSYFSLGYQKQEATGIQGRGTTGFFENENTVLSFGHDFKNKWHLMLRAAIDNRYFNAQNFYTTFLSDTANERVNSTWQQLHLSKKGEKSNIDVLVGTKQLSDIYYFRPSTSPNKNKSNLATFQFNHTYVLNPKNSWTNGIQVFNKSIRSNDRGNHEHLHAGVFSIMTHRISNKVVLTESMRADWDESYKWVMVPQINFSWSPSKLTLRASGGKSIRDADFTERYNNYNKTLVTAGSIGNPDLRAEKAWNWEAGVDYNFSSFVQVRTTYFQRDQQNLIDWISTPYASMPRKVNLSSTGTYGLASNLSSVNTRGFEIDFTGSKKVSEKIDIRWMSGMVWLNSKTPAGAQPSFYLSSHATFIWNGSVQLIMNNSSMSLSALYKERNEQKASSINATITPNYFLLNVKFEQQLLRKKMKLFLQIDNMLDVAYADLLGATMPGRWVSGGISLNHLSFQKK